jgi:predicted CoA-substrate-specific enzyme activase
MYAVGLDIGSTSAEAVILDGTSVVASSIVDTGYNSRRAADLALDRALADCGLTREQLGPVVATGYGRIAIDFAEQQVTEISCYAKGVAYLFPEVSTVIDIGGQDSKVIAVGKNGRAVDFAMNDKCAAGTGRFLEVTARALELDVSQLGEVSALSTHDVSISNICTVFAESEVITLVAEGVERADIVAGLHRAIARRTGAMVKRIGVNPAVAFAGGVAKNAGVKCALEEFLDTSLIVPPEPQIIGALGAALIALDGRSQGFS